VFVPSLSWQNDRFYYKMDKKYHCCSYSRSAAEHLVVELLQLVFGPVLNQPGPQELRTLLQKRVCF
jgi:hypothetical protein